MPDSMLRVGRDFDLEKLVGNDGNYPVGVLIISELDKTKNLLVVQWLLETNWQRFGCRSSRCTQIPAQRGAAPK